METTVVSFEKDITSVVGPNGCGKSNIVDAIRWVMGEQSAKHLRGKHMEDIIFAGSEARAPLSMASVELTFSTEGFQTPAAYLNHSEISVARKLYRTGESEYFINKVAVRLKDVTDLFLGTGIGTKAYSIIEQGRVGQIVTAKPEERRFYIEEVAGVSRFKSRKEAALRKMEATQQNLLRLTDLINEIERQMRSLDRQAKKAAKYQEVRSEYEKLDLALMARQYSKANAQQTELEGDLRRFDEEEASLKGALLEVENQVETSKIGFLEKEKEIQLLQNELFEVTNTVRITENTLRYKKEEKDGIAKKIAQAIRNREEVALEIAGVANGLEQISEQKLTADFEEETLREEVAVLEGTMAETQKEFLSLKSAVEELRERTHAGESRLSRVLAEIESRQQKQEELNHRVLQEDGELSQLTENLEKLKKIHREASSSLESLKQLKLDLMVQTDDLAGSLTEHKANLKRQETELGELKGELTLRKSRLASLEELQRNFEGYQEGTRSVLRNRSQFSEGAVYGTVADFVETDSQYEGAVSAVLGEKLQYIVVKSQAQGVEAMDYLRTASGGRTSFIPVDIQAVAEEQSFIPEQEGVLGPLKNYVSLKEDYQHLKEFLFGDVTLVSSLDKALDVWARAPQRKNLVTLDGEVIDASGVITGGSADNSSKAFLEKKREMKELSDLIASLTEQLQEKENLRSSLLGRIQSLESSLETVRTSSFEEGIRLANQEKDVSHFKKELDGLEKRRQELTAKLESQRAVLSAIQPELEAFTQESESLNHMLIADREELNVKRERSDACQVIYDEGNRELTSEKIELAQARQRNEYLNQELERLWKELNELKLTAAELGQETELAEMRDQAIDLETDHLTKMLDKKLAKKTESEASLTENRESYERLSQEIRNQEQGLKEMRRVLEESSKRLHQVTVALTEVRGQMKHLAELSLTRHQLSIAESYEQFIDAELNVAEAEERANELREQLSRLGDVNTGALAEFEELKGRFEFMTRQRDDLDQSLKALERAIQRINRTTKDKFLEAFTMVNERFQVLFPKLFHGGQAKLMLTDETNLLETGVEIVAQPPGKKLQSISLLSGGEKALTAVSLIFSIFQIKPSPFCVLDEVDAPLDDANVSRYNQIIREMTNRTQFIVITHNKKTMEMADVLYGVTMQEPGVSQLVSVDLHS